MAIAEPHLITAVQLWVLLLNLWLLWKWVGLLRSRKMLLWNKRVFLIPQPSKHGVIVLFGYIRLPGRSILRKLVSSSIRVQSLQLFFPTGKV
ncbi:hypothetical protein CBS147332_9252 [Penicillium roqueforti]|nr:hypothetical protein CBS147332_9252 [Penicillium roqueforti]KAI3103717.1 hypothetical protein CBS147331_7321 [Penicillium roqueforti]